MSRYGKILFYSDLCQITAARETREKGTVFLKCNSQLSVKFQYFLKWPNITRDLDFSILDFPIYRSWIGFLETIEKNLWRLRIQALKSALSTIFTCLTWGKLLKFQFLKCDNRGSNGICFKELRERLKETINVNS